MLAHLAAVHNKEGCFSTQVTYRDIRKLETVWIIWKLYDLDTYVRIINSYLEKVLKSFDSLRAKILFPNL